MYEYECIRCGKKSYSSSEYSYLKKKYKYCDNCGDYIFYSQREIERHRDYKGWLERESSALEKFILETKKLKDKQ